MTLSREESMISRSRNRKLRDTRTGIIPLATSNLMDGNQDLQNKISALEVQLLHQGALLAGDDSGNSSGIILELNIRLANAEAKTLRRVEVVQAQLASEVETCLEKLQRRYSVTTQSLQMALQTISAIETEMQNVLQTFGATKNVGPHEFLSIASAAFLFIDKVEASLAASTRLPTDEADGLLAQVQRRLAIAATPSTANLNVPPEALYAKYMARIEQLQGVLTASSIPSVSWHHLFTELDGSLGVDENAPWSPENRVIQQSTIMFNRIKQLEAFWQANEIHLGGLPLWLIPEPRHRYHPPPDSRPSKKPAGSNRLITQQVGPGTSHITNSPPKPIDGSQGTKKVPPKPTVEDCDDLEEAEKIL